MATIGNETKHPQDAPLIKKEEVDPSQDQQGALNAPPGPDSDPQTTVIVPATVADGTVMNENPNNMDTQGARTSSQPPDSTEDSPQRITSTPSGDLAATAGGDTGTAIRADHLPMTGSLPVLPDFVRNRDIKKELPLICHVEGCGINLATQPEYYQRYRICRTHLRSFALSVEGRAQRFCQQCGRFHDLEAFDGEKRNCRARLEQHNMRRRKVTDMNKRRYTEDDEREAYLVAQDRQRANTFHDQSTLAAETLAARFTANEQQQPIIHPIPRVTSAPVPATAARTQQWPNHNQYHGMMHNNGPLHHQHHQQQSFSATTDPSQSLNAHFPQYVVQALLCGEPAVIYLPTRQQNYPLDGPQLASLIDTGALQFSNNNANHYPLNGGGGFGASSAPGFRPLSSNSSFTTNNNVHQPMPTYAATTGVHFQNNHNHQPMPMPMNHNKHVPPPLPYRSGAPVPNAATPAAAAALTIPSVPVANSAASQQQANSGAKNVAAAGGAPTTTSGNPANDAVALFKLLSQILPTPLPASSTQQNGAQAGQQPGESLSVLQAKASQLLSAMQQSNSNGGFNGAVGQQQQEVVKNHIVQLLQNIEAAAGNGAAAVSVPK